MAQISQISRLVKRGERTIHFITGKDSIGRDCFFFIMPKDEREDHFKKMVEEDDVDLNEVGHIVAAGFGLEPSEAVMDHLVKHYFVDPAVIAQYVANAKAKKNPAAAS